MKNNLGSKLSTLKYHYRMNLDYIVNDMKSAMILEEKLIEVLNEIKYINKQINSRKGSFKLLAEVLSLENKVIKKLKVVSRFIIDIINEESKIDLDFDEVVGSDKNYYEQHGILSLIEEKKIIENIIFDYLIRELPNHPKHEHPVTRTIKRKFFIHVGETNSGKTYMAKQRFKEAESGLYLAPLRLLAYEIFEELNISNIPCDLLTGEDKVLVPNARHVACTIEKANYENVYDLVIIDEAQLLGNKKRGHSWTRAILGINSQEIHICTAPLALDIIIKLIKDVEDEYEIVFHERKSPLIIEDNIFTFPDSVKKNDALIVFNRKSVLETAKTLKKSGYNPSVIYGALPPEVRIKQMRLYYEGITDCIVSTDAIGLGMNIPIKRIIFLENKKFNGVEKVPLTSQEVKQIAGRAGRYGIFEQGYVNAPQEYKKFIIDMMKKEDKPLNKAYVSPMLETLLNIPFGNTLDKFKAWVNYEYSSDYFAKNNFSIQEELIRYAMEKSDVKLDEKMLLKAIFIPFAVGDVRLRKYWLKCLLLHHKGMEIPTPYFSNEENLYMTETDYRMFEFYKMFNDSFGLDYDEEYINNILKERAYKINQNILNMIHEIKPMF